MTSAPSVPELELLVGERTVPGLWHENYWFRRHEIAYRAIAPVLRRELSPIEDDASSPFVLEAGSGEGYGVQLLADAGLTRVAALDYDPAALVHAAAGYPAVAGRAVRGNLAHLPVAAGRAAAVLSLQVIEHLWTPWEFLAECARVLRPGGLLVLSTPNRPTFSPGLGRGEKPANPYHVREYDAAELRELVAGQVDVQQLLGVRHGPRLAAWEAAHGSIVDAQLATPPAGWSPVLAEAVRSITAADFVLDPMAGDGDPRALDLVVLSRNRIPGAVR